MHDQCYKLYKQDFASVGFSFVDTPFLLHPNIIVFSGPLISFSCSNINQGETLTLNEVLFGDVYLCSGQSNMAFGMSGIFNSTEEIENAKGYGNILSKKGRGPKSLSIIEPKNVIQIPPKEIFAPFEEYSS